MNRLSLYSIFTRASAVPTKRRCVELTSLITKPCVAVAPTCRTKGNQFARVKSLTSSETVAQNLASKGIKVLDTECGYGACEPHGGKSPFYSFHDFDASAPDSRKETKHAQKREVVLTIKTEGRVSGGDRASTYRRSEVMINYINTHAWTWYAIAAIWATILGSAI